MAGSATTRKTPRATTRRASTRSKVAVLDPEEVTESVARVDNAPEVAGGAVRLGSKVPPVEREVLFYVDDVGYTLPKTFGPAAALGYAHVQRTLGANAAVDWAMEKALGTVGYAVLREQDDLTDVQLSNMVALIVARIEGLPDPKPTGS